MLLATVTMPSNSLNYLIKGFINFQSSASLGQIEFSLGMRSDTLPGKSFNLVAEALGMGRDAQLYVYNDTAGNNVYICALATGGSLQNIAGKLELYSRGDYSTHIAVNNSKVTFDATGLTQVFASTTRTRSTVENISATSFTGVGTGLTALNAANLTGWVPLAAIPKPAVGNWFNGGVTTVGSDGVTEVGRIIDFHATANDATDYTIRLEATAGLLTLTGGVYGGSGANLINLNASALGFGTVADARLPFQLSQKLISKTINATGAPDSHLELQSPDAGGGGDIAIRFHQGNQWWKSIRANSAGFRFTNGDSNLLQPITAAAYYMGDNGGYIAGGTTGSTKIVTPSGWLEVGAQNTEYAHFYTDRSRFYFNTSVDVATEIGIYGSNTKLTALGLGWGNTNLVKIDTGQLALTGTSFNAALRLDANGAARGYIYADTTNTIGFLDQNASWAFNVQRSVDRADFYVNNVFINGSKIVSLNDLVYGSAATQALAGASMAQFKANKDAGLYNNYAVAEGAIAAGYINALFGQFNYLVANNANVTKLRANAIEVSGLGYALNQNPQFDGSAAGWTGLSAGNYAVWPTNILSGSRVSAYFLELINAVGQYVFGNQVPISAKESYSISLWIAQHAGAGTNYLAVHFVDASGSTVNPTGGKWSVGSWAYWGLVNQVAPADWTKMGIVIGGADYPIPATAVSCSIGILANYNGAAANNLRIQDYRIEKAMGSVNIADGAITANKIDVNSTGNMTADGDVSIELNPNNKLSPLAIKVKDSTTAGGVRSLFDVSKSDWADPRTGNVSSNKTNVVVNGVAGDGFIQSSYAIVESVKKSINPDYLGGADSKTWATGSMTSGTSRATGALNNPDNLAAEIS
ncbi:MAG: hypothetical protein K2W88_15295, partial [Pararheinheimera sp.]|nr:hypothetical protein [Rheinheimera sp.]